MRLFWSYMKGQKKIIGADLLFFAIFAVMFWQYHLPPEALLYPFLLCVLAGILLLWLDYGRIKAKHDALVRLRRMSASMIEELPARKTLDDEDYQEVITALCAEARELETNANIRYSDMVEYYTLWAHQIKTPIASMRLHLQNEDTPVSRRLRSDLFRVEQYVEMVLAFLRLDSKSSDYVFREYSLDGMIRQAVRKFSHEFIERRIRLEYEPVHKRIVTDEKWLSFVLEQVISNALKYTREGSVKIYLKEPELLCIEDTGIGIAPEDLPRIFENGFTGCNGRTDKKASGIGLYLCRRICDNLGIQIAAESVLAQGTIISLNLEQYPLKKESLQKTVHKSEGKERGNQP